MEYIHLKQSVGTKHDEPYDLVGTSHVKPKTNDGGNLSHAKSLFMGISYGNGTTNGGLIYRDNTNVKKSDMKQYNHQGMLVCNSSDLASETGLEPMHDSQLLGYETLYNKT